MSSSSAIPAGRFEIDDLEAAKPTRSGDIKAPTITIVCRQPYQPIREFPWLPEPRRDVRIYLLRFAP
jgi:hypothetical protein